jgi:hypothetical protein
VREQEKYDLRRNRPIVHQAQTGYMQMILDRRNDIVEDQNLKKITLNNSVPHQVDPKTVAEKRQSFAIGRYPLPGDDKRHPGEENYCRYGY